MIDIIIPGYTAFSFRHLVLDVNGTIAEDGKLLPGVGERLDALRSKLDIHLVTADTHGTQAILNEELRLTAFRIPQQNQAQAKLAYIEHLGKDSVAAIGNGANDALMLGQAALGILVVGPEGAAVAALLKADIVVHDILAGLDLLLHPRRLIATLRR